MFCTKSNAALGLLGAFATLTLQGCFSSDGGDDPTTTIDPIVKNTTHTTTPTTTLDPNSCQVLGCGEHSADETCWCTASCEAHNDCCEGYLGFCVTTTKPVPTTTPKPLSGPTFDVSVLSYNNQGWNIVQNNLWDKIGAVIDREGPFDIMGLQECPDGNRIMGAIKQAGTNWGVVESHKNCKINKGATEDVCIAWDTNKYTKLEDGVETTESDGWCTRWTDWVRLESIEGKRTFLFLNSHGAVHKCDASEGGQQTYDRYVEVIKAHRKEGDVLLMTGDWNCPTESMVIQQLLHTYAGGPEATPMSNLHHPDHIFHDPVGTIQLQSWSAFDGAPSDHQGLKAKYKVLTGSGAKTLTV